jgi:uncharacterized protein
VFSEPPLYSKIWELVAIYGELVFMNLQLQKPVLIGGLALSAGLLGMDVIHHALTNMGDLLLMSTTLAGGGYWWWSRSRSIAPQAIPGPVDRAALEKLVARVKTIGDRLTAAGLDASELQQQLQQVLNNLNWPSYRLAVTGPSRTGKTKLIANLPNMVEDRSLGIIETPALFAAGAENADTTIDYSLTNADLVLFVIDGDLTATAYQYLEKLSQRQRLLLAFNQQDRYLPIDRETIAQKIRSTVRGIIAAADVLATSADPAAIKVKAIQADGSVVESIERPPVVVEALSARLQAVLTAEGEQLRLASTYRQVDRLQTKGQKQLNDQRRTKAWPVIEQSQWIVGAAAFANPLPALDLLATAAINVQMIVDLGAIYQQKFSLEQAQVVASNLGGLLLKLGLVEFSTQTIGQILKTNAATYAIGGLIQGLSAAYLTRIVGLALVEYLEEQEEMVAATGGIWNIDRFSPILNRVFQANQRLTMLQEFVQQGIGRFIPSSQPV